MPEASAREPSPLDVQIISLLLVQAWNDLADDPDVSPFARIEALKVRLIGVQEAASALRAVASEVIACTDPGTVAIRAAAAQRAAAQKAAATRQAEASAARARLMERSAAVEALAAAEREEAEARAEAERAEANGEDRRTVLLLGGALRMASEKVSEARARLAALQEASA